MRSCTMKKMKPLLARIRLKIENEEKKSAGGIVLVQDDRQLTGSEYGIVEEIGEFAYSPPIGDGRVPIKVGDRVMIKRYAGTQFFDLDNKVRYRIVQDDDILAVETDE